MKLFKNFKTKRQLKEEIVSLKNELYLKKSQAICSEREAQKIVVSMTCKDNVPIQIIKAAVTREMINRLKPLIEWDIDDIYTPLEIKKVLRGSIYVAKKG